MQVLIGPIRTETCEGLGVSRRTAWKDVCQGDMVLGAPHQGQQKLNRCFWGDHAQSAVLLFWGASCSRVGGGPSRPASALRPGLEGPPAPEGRAPRLYTHVHRHAASAPAAVVRRSSRGRLLPVAASSVFLPPDGARPHLIPGAVFSPSEEMGGR